MRLADQPGSRFANRELSAITHSSSTRAKRTKRTTHPRWLTRVTGTGLGHVRSVEEVGIHGRASVRGKVMDNQRRRLRWLRKLLESIELGAWPQVDLLICRGSRLGSRASVRAACRNAHSVARVTRRRAVKRLPLGRCPRGPWRSPAAAARGTLCCCGGRSRAAPCGRQGRYEVIAEENSL